MKIGTTAIPALPKSGWSIYPRLKSWAYLLWPYVSCSIGGRKRKILLPAVIHAITLLCMNLLYISAFSDHIIPNKIEKMGLYT